MVVCEVGVIYCQVSVIEYLSTIFVISLPVCFIADAVVGYLYIIQYEITIIAHQITDFTSHICEIVVG